MARITVTGLIQVLTAVQAIGAAGAAVKGPLATFGSALPYAPVIETGMRYGRPWRRAGPALMFQRGLAATLPQIPAILNPAIAAGPATVAQAKVRIQKLGLDNIKALTPVRTGRLRASIAEMSRPGPGGLITMGTPQASIANRVTTTLRRLR